MWRIVFLVLMLRITGVVASAQVISVTKFYQNGKEMEMISHGVPYFSFHEFDTTLTDVAKEYLDVFGKYYRDSLLSEHQYIIDLKPGASETEREQDAKLGLKRTKVVIHYLEKNCGIGERNFRIRFHETVTSICVGFMVRERHPKRTARRERRARKKEGRFDEDIYFKDRS